MQQVFIVFFKMVVTVLLGLLLRKKRIIDERTQGSLSDILLRAVLPFTIIASSQHEYSMDTVKSIIAVAGAAILYYLCTLIVIRFIITKTKIEESEKVVFTNTSVFANTGFVGFPLMLSLFGNRGLLLASIYNLMYNLFFYTYGATLYSNRKGEIKQILFNPVSLASIGAIVLFVIPWRMPVFILDTINIVGNMTVPLSMIILGSTLATIDVKKLFTDIKSYIVTLLRLIVFPLLMTIAIIIVRKFVWVTPETAITLVLMTALPCGTMNVIYAEKYNCAPKFAARTVVMSLFLMSITLPIMLFLSSYIFLV